MLDFIATTQTEMFLHDYIVHHTHQGKYHGSKTIRSLYYKFKKHNLDELKKQLKSGLEGKVR